MQREEEIHTEKYLPSFDSLPNVYNSQDWARLTPGARSFLQVFHLGPEVQAFGPSSIPFPDSLVGAELEVE